MGISATLYVFPNGQDGNPGTHGGELLVNAARIPSVELPTGWDDSTGTILFADGHGNQQAMSWSPTGFVLVENGALVGQYPPPFPVPRQSGGTTYYVDSAGGNNANDGRDVLRAWRSLSKVNGANLRPGDTVLLKRGGVWRETLVPKTSGTAGNVIKFGAYGAGAKPVVDGQGRRNYTLDCQKPYLWFDNIDFRRGTDKSGQVQVRQGSHGVTFTDCVMRDSARGSGVGRAKETNNLRMKGCKIFDNYLWGIKLTNWQGKVTPTGTVIAECDFHNNADAKDPWSNTGTEQVTGVGGDTAVYGCHFSDHDQGDHMLYRGWNTIGPNSSEGKARIHDNVFVNTSSNKSFAPIGNKGRGSTVFRNRVYSSKHCGISQSLAYSQVGTPRNLSYIHHNLIVDAMSSNGGIGSGIEVQHLNHKQKGGRGRSFIWNNTIDDCKDGIRTASLDSAGEVEEIRGRNNLITNMTRSGVALRFVHPIIEFNHNYYYKQGGFVWNNRGVSFSSWRGHGQDKKGHLGGDPLYLAPKGALAKRNYALKPTSPARGKGTDEVWLMKDPNSWIGINYIPHATSPDAGAYRYLAGKTLDFSKYFLGRKAHAGRAAVFKLWGRAVSEAELIELTR